MSALYVLSILVTGEQEVAIKDQFQEKGWGFYKTGVRPALKDELDLFYKDVAAKITQFTKIQTTSQYPELKKEGEPTMHPLVLITAKKSVMETTSERKGPLLENCTGLTSDFSINSVKTSFNKEGQLPINELKEEPTILGQMAAAEVTVEEKVVDSAAIKDCANIYDNKYCEDQNLVDDKVELPKSNVSCSVELEDDFFPGNTVRAMLNNARSGEKPPPVDKDKLKKAADISKYYEKKTGIWCQQTRYGVNRNLRLHSFHRRCTSKPNDLDANNYSEKESGYYCLDCGYIYPKKNKFLIHKNSRVKRRCMRHCIFCDAEENKGEFHYCTKCPQVFETKDLLDRHEQRHLNALRHCKLCTQTFYTVPELNHHLKKDHAKETAETHLCDICGQKFGTSSTLGNHKSYVHSGERIWSCTWCSSKFKSKNVLDEHIERHKARGKYSCEFCGKTFTCKNALHSHVRRHTKSYSYFCDVCNKGFYSRRVRDDHLNFHNGKKPHACTICDYKCANKTNLFKHQKMHKKRGELPLSNPAPKVKIEEVD